MRLHAWAWYSYWLFTQYFEFLVGDSGHIHVVEPTTNSLYYLKKNVCPKTIIIEKTDSNRCEEVKLFIKEFSGFTNSLVSEFALTQIKLHLKFQHINSNISSIKVRPDTLDNICFKKNFLTLLKLMLRVQSMTYY